MYWHYYYFSWGRIFEYSKSSSEKKACHLKSETPWRIQAILYTQDNNNKTHKNMANRYSIMIMLSSPLQMCTSI